MRAAVVTFMRSSQDEDNKHHELLPVARGLVRGSGLPRERIVPEDALSWYRMINAAFEKYGIGRAAWSYRRMDFGICDERMDGVREELLKHI